MPTLGLDTSVVVRLLAGLPVAQVDAGRRRLEQAVDDGVSILVTDLAVAEAYHALSHHYEMPKAEASTLLARFLSSGIVRLDPDECFGALTPATGAGLVDRLIHARHRAPGATTLTFERHQGSLDGAERIRDE